MLQLGHRFYWPELGRFIQQDPIGDDINWYAYAANNPLVSIDPEGLILCDVVKAVVGGLEALGYEGSNTVSAYGADRLHWLRPVGPGGTVTIGRNPNGSVFLGGTVGLGKEIAFGNDPGGSSPNWDTRPIRELYPEGPPARGFQMPGGRRPRWYSGLGGAFGVAAMGREWFSAEYHSGAPRARSRWGGGYQHLAVSGPAGPDTGERGGVQMGGHVGWDFGMVCD